MRSDAKLLLAARTDADAFRELYERYADRVHAYQTRRCRDADAAHELTAETFAQAWIARTRFRDEAGGSAGPWLFGIARNVKQDVEYHCVLARNPAPEVSDFKGTVEPTVDATKHVSGGCRSLTSSGREWECYMGQAAVDQRIIAQGFLGQPAPAPGVG